MAEQGSDWYACEGGAADPQWCPETTPRGYKGVWNTADGINWDTQVWNKLRVLAPPNM